MNFIKFKVKMQNALFENASWVADLDQGNYLNQSHIIMALVLKLKQYH